jgi:hypothetical protein
MPARLLMIALDGADGRLLDRGTLDGTLPNLAALRSRGRGWPLSAPLGSTDDALWASFQYGVGTGEHGRYCGLLEDADGKCRFSTDEEVDREIFWDRLSAAGHRVAILDIPKCRRPRPLNGVHLTDWLTHGRHSPSPNSFPEQLAADVVARFGPAPPSRCGYEHEKPMDGEELNSVRLRLLRSIGQKRDAGLHFLSQEHWDLFAICFKEAHCSAHMFWEFCDSSHVRYEAERVARLGNPVQDVLQALDDAVGDLVSRAGADADIVVFSTSNFVPNGNLMHLIKPIVARINSVVAASEEGWTMALLRKAFRRPKSYCRSVFYSDDPSALRVPRLSDESDARYQRRLDLVVELALELVTPDDGSPVVSEVSFPDRDHKGSRADTLPQILLHYRPNICPSVVVSPRLGSISGRAPIIRTGNHTAGGFAVAAGRCADFAAQRVPTMVEFAALTETVLHGETVSATAQ